jgi:hypothetical protein
VRGSHYPRASRETDEDLSRSRLRRGSLIKLRLVATRATVLPMRKTLACMRRGTERRERTWRRRPAGVGSTEASEENRFHGGGRRRPLQSGAEPMQPFQRNEASGSSQSTRPNSPPRERGPPVWEPAKSAEVLSQRWSSQGYVPSVSPVPRADCGHVIGRTRPTSRSRLDEIS